MHEIDLPCTNCGTELVETTVPGADVPPGFEDGPVVVAECPDCGARHYPSDALERYARGSRSPRRPATE